MTERLAVDTENSLVEEEVPPSEKYSRGLTIAAKIISFILHPLFIPVYLVWMLVFVQPYLFAGFDKWAKTVFVIQAFVWYTMFPLVTVLLLRGLKFIDSIYLKTRKDRIIPYVACMIWYWWGWHVRENIPESPRELIILTLAIFLACIGGFLLNIIMKISMHTIAAGVMSSFIMWQAFEQQINLAIFISISIFLTGLVCTARFIDSNHTQKEIYSGLFIGIISLVGAIYFT